MLSEEGSTGTYYNIEAIDTSTLELKLCKRSIGIARAFDTTVHVSKLMDTFTVVKDVSKLPYVIADDAKTMARSFDASIPSMCSSCQNSNCGNLLLHTKTANG